MVEIHQIYYNDETKRHLLPGLIPYYNPDCTLFFENSVIRDLIEKGTHVDKDYFGVVGPKLQGKMNRWSRGRNYEGLYKISQFALESEADAISFLRIQRPHDPIKFACDRHEKFGEIMSELLKLIGFEVDSFVMRNSIYCNFFIATEKFWDHYTKDLLFPIMDIIEKGEEEVCKLICEDARYGDLPEVMQKKYNLEKYPYHPFILERLPNIFLMKYRNYKLINW